MNEEELYNELKKVEKEREELERGIQLIRKLEEEEDERSYRAYCGTEQMIECCSLEDTKLLRLLDEKQYILNQMKRQRQDFAGELMQGIKKKNREMDMREEDLLEQLQILNEKRKRETLEGEGSHE